MNVLNGFDAGKKFEKSIDEPTNILVGRKHPTSKANWQFNHDDYYFSRVHFTLEISPPNCLLRDPCSLNGTYLRKPGQEEEKVEEVLLKDGDKIRVGNSTVGVKITTPIKEEEKIHKPYAETFPQEKKQGQKEEELMCIRCSNPLEDPPSLIGKSLRNLDFMCPKCRKEIGSIREKEDAKLASKRYYCMKCPTDISDIANRDGRAAELADVALYLCKDCALKEMEKGREKEKKEREKAERDRERAKKEKKDLPDLPKNMVGKNIIGYLILNKLGEGGMGIVYKARHEETSRIVALKQMKKIENVDNRALLRFQREMSIMQNLKHANIVQLYEAGHYEDNPIFMSEFVKDGNLLQFVSDGGKPLLSPSEAVNIIADSLIGLYYFHGIEQEDTKKKYVHRDIKPENILLERSNGTYIPKLADFGLSRCYGERGGTITRAGEFAGTHMYMPPEQINGMKFCKPPTDIFAMGVTLYYLLTGQSPLEDFPPHWKFNKLTIIEALKLFTKSPINMMLYDPIIPIYERRRDLPRELCNVVDKSIEKKAINRYQTANSFRTALLKTIGN